MYRNYSSSLFLAVLSLIGIGIVQVYSSSFIFAIESYGDGLYFFKRQLLWSVVAVVALIVTASVPFSYIQRYGWLAWLFSSLGVAATYIPGLGVRVGGALRWIQMPFGFRVEPAELLKISISLLFASLLARNENFLGKLKLPWLAVLVALPLVLLLKQPDFGSFAIIMMVAVGLLFAFGLKWRYIFGAAVVMLPAFYMLVMTVPYRRARVMAFLDPWSDPAQKGFQVIQSMLSFHSGGLTGAGLGQGQGKLFFLPEAHTDFTLAVFGEEMGFVGFLILFALYGFIVFRGIQISVRTEDPFRRALAVGLSLTFGLNVFINAGVVMGMLPTKGLTLPFLSYGGSSLVALCLLFGILLNIENSLDMDKFVTRFERIRSHKGS